MTADLQDVLKQIAQLDKNALKHVYESLAPRFQEPEAAFQGVEQDCYEALTRLLGPSTPSPASIIKTLGSRKRYAERAAMLFAVCASGCGEPLRRQGRIALAVECLDCLKDWLEGSRIKGVDSQGSASNLLTNMGNLATAIDRNYPDYIEAKMLHRLVQLKVAA